MTAVIVPVRRRVLPRVLWAMLAVFLLAFVVLEVRNHGTSALFTAILFAIMPDFAMFVGASEGGQGRLSPRAVPYYNFLHRPWIPLAVLVGYALGPIDWVPLFVAGLAWLLHIAADRAFGYGLRNRDGSRNV